MREGQLSGYIEGRVGSVFSPRRKPSRGAIEDVVEAHR